MRRPTQPLQRRTALTVQCSHRKLRSFTLIGQDPSITAGTLEYALEHIIHTVLYLNTISIGVETVSIAEVATAVSLSTEIVRST